MRVAIVYPFFAHYRSSIIEMLSNDQKIEYHFIGGTERNSSYSSLKLHEFDSKAPFFKVKNIWFLKSFLWQKGLMKLVKQGNYDALILFADWKYITTWLVIPYLYINNIPFLFWSHGILNKRNTLNNIIKLLFFKLFRNGGFVYNNRAKDIMTSKGYEYPIEVVYNSLDYAKQSKILSYVHSDNSPKTNLIESPYVIFTGRIIQGRRLELLIDSIEILNKKGIQVRALIIGNGPHLDALKIYVEKKTIADNIIFFGSCYDEVQIANFYINSIACVFPGPIGLTAIHSLTYGTPVITNDNLSLQKPEIEAIVEGETGLYYKEGSSTSLADKIEFFCNITPDERKLYKQNCFSMIKEKFNASSQYKIIDETLTKVLNPV